MKVDDPADGGEQPAPFAPLEGIRVHDRTRAMIADLAGGLFAVVSVSAVLEQRRRQGSGTWIDVSLQGSLLARRTAHAAEGSATDRPPERWVTGTPDRAPRDVRMIDRGLLATVHPRPGEIRRLGFPVGSDGSRPRSRRAPQLWGQYRGETLRDWPGRWRPKGTGTHVEGADDG